MDTTNEPATTLDAIRAAISQNGVWSGTLDDFDRALAARMEATLDAIRRRIDEDDCPIHIAADIEQALTETAVYRTD